MWARIMRTSVRVSAAGNGVEREPHTLGAGRVRVELVRVVARRTADRGAVVEAGPREAVLAEQTRHAREEGVPLRREPRIRVEHAEVPRRLRRREADDVPAALLRVRERGVELAHPRLVEAGP